ncbi:MAG: hypothetical protein HYS21_00005 [Deltaproteobacteria bacterium]|nr:hypothetical protein [Deltaproteobacteria bacterium]
MIGKSIQKNSLREKRTLDGLPPPLAGMCGQRNRKTMKMMKIRFAGYG